MRSVFSLLIALLVGITSLCFASEGIFESIDDFQDRSLKVSKTPLSWRTWPFRRTKAMKVYKIAEEPGNRFLHAEDREDLSVEMLRYFDWEIDQFPVLSWRWRATTLPTGARENDDDLNDSACGVYVIIGRFDGHAIKYVWSSTLSTGTVITRKEGKLKIKILDAGTSKLNAWQQHRVDVQKDYKKLFGESLGKNPSGIAILTDGNATHTPAACDYDDFALGTPMKKGPVTTQQP